MNFYKKLGFTLPKAEQPLRGLELKKKKKKKAKNQTWNSMRLEFVKQDSVENLAKSLGFIKCYFSSTHILIKSASNSIRCNCQKICCWTKRPKTILETGKKDIFLDIIKKPFIYILKSSTSMYGDTTIQLVRSRWQFFRSTTGIRLGPDDFEETRSIMTFLTNFGVTRIGCTFKLVLEESAGIRKTWVTKIIVPRKDYSKQICLNRCRRQQLRKIKERM